jgi:hypothetical protein
MKHLVLKCKAIYGIMSHLDMRIHGRGDFAAVVRLVAGICSLLHQRAMYGLEYLL